MRPTAAYPLIILSKVGINYMPMSLLNPQRLLDIGNKTSVKFVIYFIIMMVMFNINAVVDAILHPDIPYFDNEHLIVGGVTGLVSIVLFWLLRAYHRYLDKAIKKIQVLENILPICAYCKRIRKIDSDPQNSESWKQLESYITEMTTTEFSHGICPECYAKLQRELSKATPTKSDQNNGT